MEKKHNNKPFNHEHDHFMHDHKHVVHEAPGKPMPHHPHGCGCGHHDHPKPEPHPHHFSNEPCFGDSNACLTKKNYLSEFRTDLEKEFARENLGLSDKKLREIVLGLPEELEFVPMIQAMVSEDEPENVNDGTVWFDGEDFYIYDSKAKSFDIIENDLSTFTVIDFSKKDEDDNPITDLYSVNNGNVTLISSNASLSIDLHSSDDSIVIEEDGDLSYDLKLPDSLKKKDYVLITADNKDEYLKSVLCYHLNGVLCEASGDKIIISNSTTNYFPIRTDIEVTFRKISGSVTKSYYDSKADAEAAIAANPDLADKNVAFFEQGKSVISILKPNGIVEDLLNCAVFDSANNSYFVSGRSTEGYEDYTTDLGFYGHEQYALMYDDDCDVYIIGDNILSERHKFISHIYPKEGNPKDSKRITIIGNYHFGAPNSMCINIFRGNEYAILNNNYLENSDNKDYISSKFNAHGVEFMLYDKIWWYL